MLTSYPINRSSLKTLVRARIPATPGRFVGMVFMQINDRPEGPPALAVLARYDPFWMHHRHALTSQALRREFTENKTINAYIHPDLFRTDLTSSLVSSDNHKMATSLSSSLQSELVTSRVISSIRCSASDSMHESFTIPSQYYCLYMQSCLFKAEIIFQSPNHLINK